MLCLEMVSGGERLFVVLSSGKGDGLLGYRSG